MDTDRVTLLVRLLMDRSARLDERDDAAIDLGDSDDARAIDALLEVGSDPNENDGISAKCGESLAHIAARGGENAKQWTALLSKPAAAEFRATLNALRPGLLK